MIRFSCPKCDTSLKSADDKAGTKTTCPRCGERLLVPAASEPEKKSGGGGKSGGKTAVASKKGTKTKGAPADEKKSSPAIMIGVAVFALAVVGAGAAVFLMGNKKTESPKTADAAPAASTAAPPLQPVAAKNPAGSVPLRGTTT